MRHSLLILLLITTGFSVRAVPQDSRPPLSKDEVLDLLITSAPSKVTISTIKQNGIAFKPTPQVLEEFRKKGADKAVLAALREAWHEEIPKPLGDREILIMLAEDVPSQNIVRTVLERGIDFQPTADYLEQLRSQGAKDSLIDELRTAVPRPFSKDQLVQQLRARVGQDWIGQEVRQRGIDFEPDNQNVLTLRSAGAGAGLLETIRTAKRETPFVAKTPGVFRCRSLLWKAGLATLICEPSDSDVPVFAGPNDLGKVVARLRCGEHVTFLERVASPPGIDRIQYADGKEGFVSNSYLESPIATAVYYYVKWYRHALGEILSGKRDSIRSTS